MVMYDTSMRGPPGQATPGGGRRVYEPLIDGRAHSTSKVTDVVHPYDGTKVGSIGVGTRRDAEAAIEAAGLAFEKWSRTPAHTRAAKLQAVASLIEDRSDLLAWAITAELGKPIRDSEGEVRRSSGIVRRAAEEAVRFAGEVIPTDGYEGSESRFAFTMRVPLGTVACIVPFNFPVSSILHKVAPALAAGNSVVIKPASATPVSAILLGEIFADAGMPPGTVNVVPGPAAEVGAELVGSDRVAMVSFTGSARAGVEIRRHAGYKRVQLEMGGNSGVIVHSDADLAAAARTVAHQGTSCAGQVCLAVQRVYVQESVSSEFLQLLLSEFQRLKIGDPFDRSTDVGPLVNEGEAKRIEAWISEARTQGATVETGGERIAAIVQPTILTHTSPSMRIVAEELFGPAVALSDYRSIDDAIDLVNNSIYGLQAGVFTSNVATAFHAARGVQAGGVMINDGPRYRIDSMPYGGTKMSGIGREGTRYAMEEMTDVRVVVFNNPPAGRQSSP